MMTKITIVDYGMGNLWSVSSALQYLGAESVISNDPAVVAGAEALILPGVGSFFNAMQALHDKRLDSAVMEAVRARGRKILGICLGMQLLAERGTEDGECAGLGLIPGTVRRFTSEELGSLKLPHIGFNEVRCSPNSRLFNGISHSADFYFVHSYRLLPSQRKGASAHCTYGCEFLAAYEHSNIFATQFHPEKSQTNGLLVLKNFLAV